MGRKKTFLIIKLGDIGDVIMALPLLMEIKERTPHSHVTWVVGPKSRPLLDQIGLIDRIIEVDDRKKNLLFLLKLWVKLSFKRYDVVMTAYRDWRYRLISLFCFKKKHHHFHKTFPMPGRYQPQEYAKLYDLKERFGSQPLLWPEMKEEPVRKKKTIALTVARDHKEGVRAWPIESYLFVAKSLLREGYEVILTGTKEDECISSYFHGLGVVNLIGKTTLPELLDVFKSSSLVVTHDGGALHLARFAGAAIVAIFGPTNPFEFVSRLGNDGQLDERIRVLWGGRTLSCRPCYDGKCFAKCKDPECMRTIAAKTVLREIKQALG